MKIHTRFPVTVCLMLLVVYGSPLSASGPPTSVAHQQRSGLEDNAELRRMYEADQSARQSVDDIDWTQLMAEDERRRQRVMEMAEEGLIKTAADHYHAAMILQHGNGSEDYKMAHELASEAVRMDPAHKSARWLSCAAEDRWLHSLGKAQIWGTQFRREDMDSPWTMEPFDRDAKTDQERIACGVRTLEESMQRLDEMNRRLEEKKP
ncbi:MAG TPA: hypothetical protein VLU25_06425 [Acidobacteriota bacterium]|nr:hypothetical protein [Acidobacteriota bacterium]